MPDMEDLKNKAQEIKGTMKQKMGKTKNDPNQQAEGKDDEFTANLKQAGKNLKDAFKS